MDKLGTPLQIEEHEKATTSTSPEANRIKTEISKLKQELADMEKKLQRV
ncbi:MAG: hypothetical protein PHW62_00970 [Candidatus Ratteibacteria bacterium]|nr:hypothetical protein [Candidatus Ratteibacteria bacterium]